MRDLRRWLEERGLAQTADVLIEHDIDLDILPDLVDTDLERLGLSLGERKRLLKAAASLRAGQEAEPPAASSNQDRPKAERRQVTILFCDLVGSSTLAERLDPEDMREVLQDYRRHCARVIGAQGGTLVRYIGDGVLACFGYPVAHEDDATRAIRAGLEIVAALPAVSVPPDPGGRATLEVRIGIHTGMVVAGDVGPGNPGDSMDLVGGTPNIAARLQGLAAPNAVTISGATHKLAAGRFVFDDQGLHALKGIADPVQVYRVRGESGLLSRFEASMAAGLTPLVDREAEIGLLHHRWRKATAGEGQVTLVSGEAGIGKSRIVQALHEQLSPASFTRLWFQCSANHQGSALHPVIAQLELAAGFEAADTPADKLDKLERLVAIGTEDVPRAARILARLLSLPAADRYGPIDLEPRQIKEATLEVLLAQLAGLARRRPVLIVFEDLHWIDPTTHELLDTLIEQVPALPTLVICTLRPDYTSPWVGHPRVTTLSLGRFDGPQSAEVVASISGGYGLPAQVADQIFAKTDGVPLFLEELTKAVLESGSLRLERGRYILDGGLDDLTLPSTLQGSLLARLDRLPGVSSVAPVGAAIGRSFSYALLAAVTDLADDVLEPILQRLIDAQLVLKNGQGPEATYTFKHALVQDAAYATLLKSKRQALHAKIATTMRERFADTTLHRPEIIAQHYTRASMADEALDYWRRAAAVAVQNSGNAEAIAHLRAALEQNEKIEDPARRVAQEIELREMLGVSLEAHSWGSAEIADNLDRLYQLLEGTDDRKQLFSILHGLCGIHVIAGRLAAGRRHAERMSEVAEQGSEPAFGLLSQHALAMCRFFAGDLAVAIGHFDRTIVLAHGTARREAGAYYVADPRLIARCMSAWACLLQGDRAEAERRIKAALRAARAHKHMFSKTYAFGIIASFHQSTGDPIAALDFANLALKLSREHNNRYWESWAQIVRGWALAAQGRHEDGITVLAQGIEMYAATGSRLILRYARALLADAHYHAGNIREGMRIARELEDTQAGSEVRFFDLVVEGIFARLRSAPVANIVRGEGREEKGPQLASHPGRRSRGRPNRPQDR